MRSTSLPSSAVSTGEGSAADTRPDASAALGEAHAPPSPLHRVKLVALIVFLFTSAWLGWQVARGGIALGLLWWFPVIGAVGYVAADLVSGLVHFLADNFAEEDTPIIGAAFVKPFRDHHTDPTGITRHDFVETNGNNVIVSLPFVLPAALWLPSGTNSLAWVVAAFTLCFILAIFLTNQFHKWAHEPVPPPIALRLQRAGLILSKEHHDVHHTSPFDTHYCITVGLWNKLLERVQLWEHLERAIRRWVPGTDPRMRVVRDAEARASAAASGGAVVDG